MGNDTSMAGAKKSSDVNFDSNLTPGGGNRDRAQSVVFVPELMTLDRRGSSTTRLPHKLSCTESQNSINDYIFLS